VKKIGIIGGGISGLSAAFYLEKARRNGADLSFTIFEQSDRLGGALLTEQVNGCIVEAGADSFLSEKPWATELCQELGIGDQLIGSNDGQRQTFIVRKNKLVPLPAGMSFFVPTDPKAIQRSELFSAKGKQRILREASFRPRGESQNDEAVADFVTRHFGVEMVERIADPLLAGIYGGDARQLSMQTVLPRFLEMERRSGSLMRALSESSMHSKVTKPLFTSLKNGMQQLVNALTAHLPTERVQAGAEVVGLEFNGSQWRVLVKDRKDDLDSVILAVPAYASAQLLTPVLPNTAKLLRQISYSSSVTVALGFRTDKKTTTKLPAFQGFGFLVPHIEGHRMLACTFVQNKFSNRVPSDRRLLRVFFGGVHDEAVLQLTDEDLVRLAQAEIKTLLKVQAEAVFARVHRWPRAMPQYNVGHKDLVKRITEAAGELPGLILAGNAYQGVGVPDCVRQGREAALQLTGATRDFAPAT
jgi:protoporphyrinogen/coproporphyrinogen III oxidase